MQIHSMKASISLRHDRIISPFYNGLDGAPRHKVTRYNVKVSESATMCRPSAVLGTQMTQMVTLLRFYLSGTASWDQCWAPLAQGWYT